MCGDKEVNIFVTSKNELVWGVLEKKKTSNDAKATGLKEKEGMNIENLQLHGTRMTTL